MEKEYAQALAESITNGTDEALLVAGLVKHLKSAGRMKLLPGILRELKSIDERERKLAPRLEVASEAEKAGAVKAAGDLGMKTTTVSVNPSLIKGWRYKGNGTLVDRSAKQALVDLYQKITN